MSTSSLGSSPKKQYGGGVSSGGVRGGGDESRGNRRGGGAAAEAEDEEDEEVARLPQKKKMTAAPTAAVRVVQPATCAEYLTAMQAVRRACEQEGTVPLYHYTMLSVAPFILGGGFRMSTQGQGDGGVYFSTLGPCSYNLGGEDYEENIIVDW